MSKQTSVIEEKYITDNKEQIVESVIDETGMDSDEDKELIENTVDNLALDQEFKDKEFSKSEISTSLIEDIISLIKSNNVITEGEIININKSSDLFSGKLCVEIQPENTNETFTEEFNYEKDNMGNKLSKFFLLLGLESGKPSDLIGEKVPLNHNSLGDDKYNYKIHWPPESGLFPKIIYQSNRIGRKLRLVNLTDNKSYDLKYKPTIWSYVASFMIFFIAEMIGSGFTSITLTLLFLCSICVALVMNIFTFMESKELI